MHLDLAGVAASGGSACSTGAVEPSHVLVAMGVPRELALGAVRFSFGPREHRGRRRPGGRAHARRGGQGAAALRRAGAGGLVSERVLVAMSGGVDSSVAAARLVEQGYEVVGRHDEAVLLRRRRARPPLLLARLDQRRPRRRPHARHPALRAEPRRPVRAARDRQLRQRVQPGPDADPLRAVQLVHQVPRSPRPRRRARLRVHRHRPLRRGAGRRALSGARSQQGPELFPLGRGPRGGGPDAHAGRRDDQGGDPRPSPDGSASPPPTSPSRSRSASCPTTTTSACWSGTSRRTPPPSRPGPW